jgi:Bacterial Ig domain
MLRAAVAASLIALAMAATAHALLPPVLTPDTRITSAPAASTTETSARFAFDSTLVGSRYECRLDGGAWADCSSPKTYLGLSRSRHVFEVRATDFLGDTDRTPARHEWTIESSGPPPPAPDTTPPETSISSGPSGSTTATSADFGFGSSEAGSTFECRLDAGAWGACASPKGYSDLSAGAHTFSVRAEDAAGNVDASPATRQWTVAETTDTEAPEIGFRAPLDGQRVSGRLDEPSANCEALASDPNGVERVEFYLDGQRTNTEYEVPYACTIDTTAYTDGPHTLMARAVDQAGNSSTASVSVVFDNVPDGDTTAPDTAITGGPSGSTTSTSAGFGFRSNEPGSTFECRLDAGAWGACASPKSYSGLAQGSHTFSVRAEDAAGNVDASPASRTWTVEGAAAETTPPNVGFREPAAGQRVSGRLDEPSANCEALASDASGVERVEF